MYDDLKKRIKDNGLQEKAEANLSKTEAIKKEFADKKKLKPLTDKERLLRIEKYLGIDDSVD